MKCSLIIIHWREPSRAPCGNAASRLEIFFVRFPSANGAPFPCTDRPSSDRVSLALALFLCRDISADNKGPSSAADLSLTFQGSSLAFSRNIFLRGYMPRQRAHVLSSDGRRQNGLTEKRRQLSTLVPCPAHVVTGQLCFKRWPSFQVPGLVSLKE